MSVLCLWMRRCRRLAAAILMLCLLLPAAAQSPALIVGVFAYRDKAVTLARWQPLADYLSQKLGKRRIEMIALEAHEIEAALQEKKLDFVFTNPRHYVELNQTNPLSGALVTLVELKNGKPVATLGGVIVARSERRDIAGLADLRGKRIAIVSRSLLGGYVAPLFEAERVGITLEPEQFLVTGGAQDRVIEAVLAGTVDAGFVRTGVLEQMAAEGMLDLQAVRVINRQEMPEFPFLISTRQYPEWPFVSLPHVDSRVARRVAAALLEIEPDDMVAKLVDIHGFSVPADYLPVENAVRELRLPPFDKLPRITWQDVWEEHGLLMAALGASVAVGLLLLIFLLLNMQRLAAARRGAERNARALEKRMKELACLYAVFQVTDDPEVDLESMLQTVADRIPAAMRYPEIASAGIFHQGRRIASADFSDGPWCIEVKLDVAPAATDCLKVVYLEKPPSKAGDPFLPEERELLRTVGERLSGVIAGRRVAAELEEHRHHLEELVEARTHELDEAKQLAEAANSAKSVFLANMSHEIRTPMNAIIGLTHQMMRDAAEPKQHGRLVKVDAAARILLGLINDVLDLSKIEAGQMRVESTAFDLAGVIEDVGHLVRDRAAEKGLTWKVERDPAVPLRLRGDPLRLGQVLTNFASNAVKFTEQGGAILTVSPLPAADHRIWLRFAVQDSGIGIGADALRRIFSPFEQADTSITRKYGGSGLGLAIVRHIAAMMGGRVGVESALGKGSTFWFEAPFEAAGPAEAGKPYLPAGQAESEVAMALADRVGASILIVEDNPVNREVALDMLESAGLAADVAQNGREALDMVRVKSYDLIMMDIQMPEMDGIEATRRIRELPGGKEVAILAVTANVFEEDRRRCLDAGMNDHFAKPLTPDRFYAALKRWLPQQKTRPATREPAATAAEADSLPSIAGLDTAAGLVNVNGRVATYRKLLAMFIEHHGDDVALIRAALGEGRIEEARRLAHSLKGAAGTLGAKALNAAALTLEIAIKSAINTAGPSTDFAALLGELETAIEQLLGGLRALSGGAVAATSAPAPATDLLQRFEAYLAVDDIRASTLWNEQRDAFAQLLAVDASPIHKAVARYDFIEALRLLRAAKRRLGLA
jgi:signal transduction histidine kinase/DNA-binding response OmpR family regulator/ABC-type phosphate/phosphonate transport system substrate-binding protein